MTLLTHSDRERVMRMSSIRKVKGGVTAAKGFTAAGVRCGLKSKGRDLAVLSSQSPAVAAGVFTTNRFAAAPVRLCRQRLRRCTQVRAVVVNAGNANACTGDQGEADAAAMAQRTASQLGLTPAEVLVASTGIIGTPLDMRKVNRGIAAACRALSRKGSDSAAQAIMTTDLVPKQAARKLVLGRKKTTVVLGGMAKGSGMIHPNLATMLAFLTTDAAIDSRCLRHALRAAANESFNMMTVDGDTSTNDTVLLLANGQAGNARITNPRSPDYELFFCALKDLCQDLAIQIARDGEGATRLIRIAVEGARSRRDARAVAKSVAGSNLVKTAVFGGDPNWGRILCAVGYSGVTIDPGRVSLWIGPAPIVRDGQPLPGDAARAAPKAMKAREVCIRIALGQGKASVTAWTCDLSYDYVRINAEYHT